jgi:hypothetical protein
VLFIEGLGELLLKSLAFPCGIFLFFAFNVLGGPSGKPSVKRVASRIGKDDIEMFQEPLEEDPISIVSLGFH